MAGRRSATARTGITGWIPARPRRGALKGHFERAQNVMGRPTYRRHDWEEIRRPVDSAGDRIAVLGKLEDVG
jgi:hypothetical protein